MRKTKVSAHIVRVRFYPVEMRFIVAAAEAQGVPVESFIVKAAAMEAVRCLEEKRIGGMADSLRKR